MTLDRILYDNSLFYTFLVTVGFVRSKASVLSCIFDDFIMNEAVKGDVFEFTGRGNTKNWMVLFELHQ